MNRRSHWKKTTAWLLSACTVVSMASGPLVLQGSAEEFGSHNVQTAKHVFPGQPADGVTQGQPFIKGVTGGSDNFRIPALITLADGTLLASADARYDHTGDAAGLDTLVSYSQDNGKTWNYTFANYFNDSTDAFNNRATAFIDPLLVQDHQGTVHLLVDLFPGGIALNTVSGRPDPVSGYINIDGTQRLVLYPEMTGQTDDNFTHYVGDFSGGYAPILAAPQKGDSGEDPSALAYDDPVYDQNGDVTEQKPAFVDAYYNIYDQEKQPIYCKQLGSDKMVQQNVFYYNANLHVRNATYLWLVSSKDQGKTWSAPTILNPQVRKTENGHDFYGVGPGAGLVLHDGTLLMPAYTFKRNTPNSSQIASFIYSRDNGKTWHRSEDATSGDHWSSESVLVQIDDTTVRHFYRDGKSTLYYTDHTWSSSENKWKAGEPVDTGVHKTYNNQLSAIRYSKLIDGKPAIMVSTAAGNGNSRSNGKIYTFLLNPDKTMELAYEYSVTKDGYSYSSLTEQKDGSLGLLYEPTGGAVFYENIPIWDAIPGGVIDGHREITVPLYGLYQETVKYPGPSASDLAQADSSIVGIERVINPDNTITLLYVGRKEGTTSFMSNGVRHTITVRPEAEKHITVKEGETVSIEVPEGVITVQPDSSIATARVETVDEPLNGPQVSLGKDKNFQDEMAKLSNALYTFHEVDDDDDDDDDDDRVLLDEDLEAEVFEISATTTSGTKVYLYTGAAGYPNNTAPGQISVIEHPSKDGIFHLKGAEEKGKYLYFWKDGKNYFDIWGGLDPNKAELQYELYRPVESGESSSAQVPGYVLVDDLDDIEDGGQYLIVTAYKGDRYVLYPHAGKSDKYAHVGKVYPQLTQKKHYLKVTGVSWGTTDIMVDGVVYRIKVETRPSTDSGSGGGGGYQPGGSSRPTPPRPPVTPPVVPPIAPPVPTVDTFTDMDRDDWFYPAVSKVTELGLMTGTGDGQFSPHAQTTRAMLAMILFRIQGSPETALDTSFADVSSDSWYATAVSWAKQAGIATGTGDGSFGPDDVLTREQIAVMFHQMAKNLDLDLDLEDDLPDFTDKTSVSSWAEDSVAWAVSHGLITGREDVTLAPDAPATRAEVAQMVSQFLSLMD